ncbi:helix-hairpin-helix domain-containing protein [Thermoclostridium stercorarium]|uniref:Competence protein ComEA n=1 Tax=Thermoclostridium stercorarium subsp. leptospartum DSM 9219 TaxID=1346611 RepID=A0A1B1YJ13_THEST|nr:competence protein ComEA [Thermoclostridium stercorarium subsp. leptospartum DSM 9219]
MKFKILGIEITVRKEYAAIGVIMLILILAVWGWYLKTNRVEVFDAGKNKTEKQVQVEIQDNKSIEKNNTVIENTEVSNEPLYININTADLSTLMKLHGIGEVKARAIIEYRERNGPFKSIEEIKNVKGIGEATFQKIKDRIVVGTEGRKPLNMDLLK